MALSSSAGRTGWRLMVSPAAASTFSGLGMLLAAGGGFLPGRFLMAMGLAALVYVGLAAIAGRFRFIPAAGVPGVLAGAERGEESCMANFLIPDNREEQFHFNYNKS